MVILESFIIWVAIGVWLMLTIIKFYYKEYSDGVFYIIYMAIFIYVLYHDIIKYWYC